MTLSSHLSDMNENNHLNNQGKRLSYTITTIITNITSCIILINSNRSNEKIYGFITRKISPKDEIEILFIWRSIRVEFLATILLILFSCGSFLDYQVYRLISTIKQLFATIKKFTTKCAKFQFTNSASSNPVSPNFKSSNSVPSNFLTMI